MKEQDNKTTRYRRIVMIFACVLVLGLVWLRLAERDVLNISDDEPGYVQDEVASNGDRILAEGCEQIYLQPGSYRLVVCTAAPNANVYMQVYDKWENHVLAEQAYDPGAEAQAISFTTDDLYIDVVVRSLTSDGSIVAEDLQIQGYHLESEGRACTDATWSMVLLVLLMVLFYVGYRRMIDEERPAFLILTVASAVISLPLYSVGLQIGHDLEFQLNRITNIGLAMRWGYYPERLNVLTGGDTIIPIMYPEALLAGAGFMVSTGATVMLAYKVLCTCLTFATAYIAYYATRQVVEKRTALLFALLWLINPFRINEVLIRAALGEAIAIAFLPLIAVGMWQMFHDSCRQGSKYLLIGYTGLLASHMLTTLIAAIFCAFYVAIELVGDPRRFVREIRRVGILVLTAGFTVLVNMYFLVPFLSYYDWNLYLSHGQHSAARVQDSAAPLWQLFMGEVGYGNNIVTTQINGEMPISIGPALLGAMILWAGYTIWQRRHADGTEAMSADRQRMLWTAWILSLIGIFMSSIYFPWNELFNRLQLLANIFGSVQFAWRFMMIPGLLLSFLMAVFVCDLLRQREVVYRLIAAVLVVMAVQSAVRTATDYYSLDELKLTDHFDGSMEYNFDYILQGALVDHQLEFAEWPIKGLEGPAVLDGSDGIVVEDYHQVGDGYTFTVTNASNEDVTVTIPIFWYGLHNAYLTGDTEDMLLDCTMNEDYQFTDVTVPAGVTHAEIRLVCEQPRRYALGYLVSGVAIVGWVAAQSIHKRHSNHT